MRTPEKDNKVLPESEVEILGLLPALRLSYRACWLLTSFTT